jgi:hypothetical protein
MSGFGTAWTREWSLRSSADPYQSDGFSRYDTAKSFDGHEMAFAIAPMLRSSWGWWRGLFVKPRIIYAALAVFALSMPAVAQRSGTGVSPLIVDEDGSPSSSFLRPLAPAEAPPPRSSSPRTRPQGDKDGDALLRSKLNIIIEEPGVAVPPKPEPLPKLRRDANIEAVPLPSRSPESKRQPASVPMPPISPRPSNATRAQPRDANVNEPDRDDVLPPPPERLPRRAVPALPPKPADRTAAMPPKPEPLPKSRPDASIEAVPLPSPAPAEAKRQPASLPMPPIPLRSSSAAPPSPRVGTTQPNKSGDAPSTAKVIMADPEPDNLPPAPESVSREALHNPL